MQRLAHAVVWILIAAVAIALLLFAASFIPMPIDVASAVKWLIVAIVVLLTIGAIVTGRDPLKWK